MEDYFLCNKNLLIIEESMCRDEIFFNQNKERSLTYNLISQIYHRIHKNDKFEKLTLPPLPQPIMNHFEDPQIHKYHSDKSIPVKKLLSNNKHTQTKYPNMKRQIPIGPIIPGKYSISDRETISRVLISRNIRFMYLPNDTEEQELKRSTYQEIKKNIEKSKIDANIYTSIYGKDSCEWNQIDDENILQRKAYI